ncbi:MAG: hypothetical protein COA68_12305 [Oceanobacter sp.]|nr:MAG: hypothetical protein COA68_12305 [Oceanobacter sp.]
MSAMQKLAGILGCAVEQIPKVSKKTLELALEPMTVSERAAVEIALAQNAASSDDGASVLADHLRRKEIRAREKWRIRQEWAESIIKHVHDAQQGAEGLDGLRAAYRNKAKAHTLTPLEVLLGQWLLFSTDPEFGRFFIMYLCLHVQDKDRVALHNWNVVQEWAPVEVTTYGEQIEALEHPLFPHCTDLATLNEALINGVAQATGGGGRSNKALYRHGTPLGEPAPTGGGVMPIVATQNGSAVDSTDLEAALAMILESTKKNQVTTNPPTNRAVERAFDPIFKAQRVVSDQIAALGRKTDASALQLAFSNLREAISTAQRSLKRAGTQRQHGQQQPNAKGGEPSDDASPPADF